MCEAKLSTNYEKENYLETDTAGKKIFKLFPYSPNLTQDYKNLINYNYEEGIKVKGNVLSLKIDGNYLAILFEDTNFQNKCEVISTDQFNLGIDHPVGKNVSSLKVIPAQK